MTGYRPRLRAHLQVVGSELVDGWLERAVTLDGAAAALAPLLDGAADWAAIRARMVDDGHDADDLDGAMRGLLCLHAVEGAGDALTGKLDRAVHQPGAAAIAHLDGARFACQGSGGCCSGYVFGPLSDEDAARLGGLDLAAAFPHLAPPYLDVIDGGRYLRKDGDRCVFLAGDHRCGLHAAFGAGAKPDFCQLYPLDGFGTVEGVRVVDRGTCATFGVSARTGLPLADDLARIRPLIARPGLHHPVTFVDGRPWDHGLYLRFTQAAGALVERGHGTAVETLHALGRGLDALAGAVGECPLAPGQPDEVAGQILDGAGASWYQPVVGYAGFRGVRSLGTVLSSLRDAVLGAIEDGRARASAARFEAFAALVERTADAIVYYDGTPLPPPAPHPPDVEDALRLSLRQQLFGRHALVGGHAGAGLVRMGLIQLVALSGARTQAGARPLTAADLSHGHMLATRALHASVTEELLAELEPRWREVLDGLALAAVIAAA